MADHIEPSPMVTFLVGVSISVISCNNACTSGTMLYSLTKSTNLSTSEQLHLVNRISGFDVTVGDMQAR